MCKCACVCSMLRRWMQRDIDARIRFHVFHFLTVGYVLRNCFRFLCWMAIAYRHENQQLFMLSNALQSSQITPQCTFRLPLWQVVFNSLQHFGADSAHFTSAVHKMHLNSSRWNILFINKSYILRLSNFSRVLWFRIVCSARCGRWDFYRSKHVCLFVLFGTLICHIWRVVCVSSKPTWYVQLGKACMTENNSNCTRFNKWFSVPRK